MPPEILKIIDQGDINVVFVPRTRTRYFEYAPLFHLLPRRTPAFTSTPAPDAGFCALTPPNWAASTR